MKLKIDRSKVTEGDVVTVKWDAGRAKSVTGAVITIDNGFRKAEIPVERSGEKKFRLNRSEGKTVIVFTAVADGKFLRAEQRVRVKAGRQYDSYTVVRENVFKRLGMWLKLFWQSIPHDKRHSWVMLFILFLSFVLSIFHTTCAFYGLGILALYLIWTLL
ncbi:MAG: hypothetical protein KBS57_05500 [Alistipes sp.]|nr:hypothetical protein [Candidatus Minthomonas equi]